VSLGTTGSPVKPLQHWCNVLDEALEDYLIIKLNERKGVAHGRSTSPSEHPKATRAFPTDRHGCGAHVLLPLCFTRQRSETRLFVLTQALTFALELTCSSWEGAANAHTVGVEFRQLIASNAKPDTQVIEAVKRSKLQLVMMSGMCSTLPRTRDSS
jgi:hypothetical protein